MAAIFPISRARVHTREVDLGQIDPPSLTFDAQSGAEVVDLHPTNLSVTVTVHVLSGLGARLLQLRPLFGASHDLDIGTVSRSESF